MRSSKLPARSRKGGMRCKDCALPQSNAMILRCAISTLGEELADRLNQPSACNIPRSG